MPLRAGSLAPLEKARGFGMTPPSLGVLVEADYVAGGIAEAGFADQGAGAANGCTLAPLIRSQSMIASSPKRTGKTTL